MIKALNLVNSLLFLLYCSVIERYVVQLLNVFMDDNPDHFNILRKIENKPGKTMGRGSKIKFNKLFYANYYSS